jgi:hypothetical protein
MGIVNRRNAVMGWAVWKVAKRVGKRKAKDAVPGTVEGTRRPNKSALALIAATAVGAATFWRKHTGGDEESTE